MSTELHTLSGAFALDALSPEEAEEFRRHLEECQACRDEVRELREAAARIGAGEALAAPPALRARVLAAADRQPQLPPKVTALETFRSKRKRLGPRLAAAAAAIVLVAGGAFALTQREHQDSSGSVTAAVSQVFSAPDVHTAVVDTRNGGRLTVATSHRLGAMALKTDGLPKLSHTSVYQLWAIHDDGTTTSAGVVGNLTSGQRMALPPAGTTVAVTVEPSGGSPQPTTKPIVEMDPEQV
jgi:anti-sigma-K factor RskA